MKKETGGYAFPMPLGNEDISPDVAGMTLRDYFAIRALPIAWDALDKGYFDSDDHNADLSKAAYQMADAMRKARSAE